MTREGTSRGRLPEHQESVHPETLQGATGQSLTHMVDRLQRVLKATKELNSTLDLSELARIILRIVRDEVGIERGTVFVVAPDGNRLTSIAAQEVDQAIQVPIGKGIAGSVAQTGEAVDILEAYRDSRFDPSFDFKLGFHTRDIYCMPLRNRTGSIVGVLQLLNRNRTWTKEDEGFLADVTVHIGHAIENATRHLQILEQKRIEQQIELAREIVSIRSVRKMRLMFSTLARRCPICLHGSVFIRLFAIRRNCDHCGFYFSRHLGYVLGSAVYACVVTFAGALAASFALDYVIRSAGSTAVAITLAVAASFLVWLYQCWRMLWMAVDLYKSPPMAQDFDLSKGFLTSQANPETAVSRKQTATP